MTWTDEVASGTFQRKCKKGRRWVQGLKLATSYLLNITQQNLFLKWTTKCYNNISCLYQRNAFFFKILCVGSRCPCVTNGCVEHQGELSTKQSLAHLDSMTHSFKGQLSMPFVMFCPQDLHCLWQICSVRTRLTKCFVICQEWLSFCQRHCPCSLSCLA